MIINLNHEIVARLSKTELGIVHFINTNEAHLPELSIVDIALDTYSSPATVSRAIRKCGINGFNELRYRLASKAKKSEVQNMGEVINKSLTEVQRGIEQLSIASVYESIRIIKNARRIFVFGRGLSEYVAEEFALKLQLLDFNAAFIKDPNIMRIRSQHIQSDEIIIIFSLNGKTLELIEAAENAGLRNANVVTCCCNENAPLIEQSTCSLIGYKHSHVAIKEYEVSSRLPLQMIARIIIDYIVTYEK